MSKHFTLGSLLLAIGLMAGCLAPNISTVDKSVKPSTKPKITANAKSVATPTPPVDDNPSTQTAVIPTLSPAPVQSATGSPPQSMPSASVGPTLSIPEILGTFPVGNSPKDITIDGLGNAWVANNRDNSVSKLSPAGVTLGTYPAGKFPQSIAIDGVGNVWVGSYKYPFPQTVTKLSMDGVTLGAYPVQNIALDIDIDGNGNVWVATGLSATKLSPAGETLGAYKVGTDPLALAIDGDGNVWVANSFSNNVTKLSSAGVTLGTYAVGEGPVGIAIDSFNNAWVTNAASNTVTKLTSTGATLGTFPVGDGPARIAIDNIDSAWVILNGSKAVVNLSPEGMILHTFAVGESSGIAVDDLGSVWVANSDNKVTKIGRDKRGETGSPTTTTGGTTTGGSTTCRLPAGAPAPGTAKHGAYNGVLLPDGWARDLADEAAVTNSLRVIEVKGTDWSAFQCIYPGANTVYLTKR